MSSYKEHFIYHTILQWVLCERRFYFVMKHTYHKHTLCARIFLPPETIISLCIFLIKQRPIPGQKAFCYKMESRKQSSEAEVLKQGKLDCTFTKVSITPIQLSNLEHIFLFGGARSTPTSHYNVLTNYPSFFSPTVFQLKVIIHISLHFDFLFPGWLIIPLVCI